MKASIFYFVIVASLMFDLQHTCAGEDSDGGFRIFVKGQDRIYAFAMDMIRSLNDCRHAFPVHPTIEVHPAEGDDFPSDTEKLELARSRMADWRDSNEEDVRKVAEHFSHALNDLISCLKLVEKSSEEKKGFPSRLAEKKCKTGYQKIREARPLIVGIFFRQGEPKPGLSKERLRFILQFCKDTFQRELLAIEERTTAATEEPFRSTILVLKLSLEEAIEGIR